MGPPPAEAPAPAVPTSPTAPPDDKAPSAPGQPLDTNAVPQPPPPVPAARHAQSSNLSSTITSEVAEYADTDHVFVFTPSLAGTVSNPTAGWTIGGSYLLDVVSAASVDIVSTASRRWEEIRNEGSLQGAYQPGTFGVGVNALVSSEPDYLSLNGGASITKDLFDKNLTLLFSYNYGHDVAGRTGTPFSVFSHTIDRNALKAGATVVLDHATVASFVGDVIIDSGDQSKPYRYVPLFAPGQYVPVGAPVALVTSLRVSERPLEQLPLSRDRFAVSARLARRFHASTLRLDERLYVDTWGLKASTTDARLLFQVGRIEAGPHLRLHAQSAVDFWQRAYVMDPGFTYPALRTGDRELGPLVNATAGGSLAVALGPRGRLRAWIVGVNINATWTQYLDDLYITERLAFVGGLTLGAEL
jgi:hypothetical protein